MIFKRLCMLALLSVCGYSTYYLFIQHDKRSGQRDSSDTEKPLFTAEKVKSTSYTEQGERNYKLDSIYLEHFLERDETHFKKPILWTYQDGTNQEWRLTSHFAVLKNNRTMTMKGNVKIYNLLPDSRIKSISTEELTLDLVTRDFWSKTKTDILGVGFRSNGNQMKGNFGLHQMELIEQVNSKYETIQ